MDGSRSSMGTIVAEHCQGEGIVSLHINPRDNRRRENEWFSADARNSGDDEEGSERVYRGRHE